MVIGALWCGVASFAAAEETGVPPSQPAMKFMPLDAYRKHTVQRAMRIPSSSMITPGAMPVRAASADAPVAQTPVTQTSDARMSQEQAKQILSVFRVND